MFVLNLKYRFEQESKQTFLKTVLIKEGSDKGNINILSKKNHLVDKFSNMKLSLFLLDYFDPLNKHSENQLEACNI